MYPNLSQIREFEELAPWPKDYLFIVPPFKHSFISPPFPLLPFSKADATQRLNLRAETADLPQKWDFDFQSVNSLNIETYRWYESLA